MTLNTKQRAFIEEYLICWNASEAARRAGYNGKSNVVGSQLLANLSIKTEIDNRLDEMRMSSNEVLKRLSDMARADISDFVRVAKPTDLLRPRYKGKTHVIKKFKKTTVHTRTGDTIVTTELELYDSRSTLVDLGRHHKLFTDRIEVTWKDELTDLVRKGIVTPQDIANEFGSEVPQGLLESFGISADEVGKAEVESSKEVE